MSNDFKCEQCGTTGRRRNMCLVPDGWLYAEVKDFETGQIIVIGICSATCMMVFFKPGPGKLTDPHNKETSC